MDLGPNAAYIVASYAAATVIVGALLAWLFGDAYRLQQRLQQLEAQGVTRRSAGASGSRHGGQS
jgi:heme exporter protein D